MTTAVTPRRGRAGGSGWGGGRGHRLYTVVIFIVLNSLEYVAIALAPPLFSPISHSFGVAFGSVTFAVGATYLVSAAASVAWAYVGDRSDRKRLLMIGTLIWAVGTFGTAVS